LTRLPNGLTSNKNRSIESIEQNNDGDSHIPRMLIEPNHASRITFSENGSQMTRYHFENYDDAAEYLSHARNRDKGRPLPGSCTRLKDMGEVYVTGTHMKAIGIFLYGTCVIRYLKTNSGRQYISASTGGHQTQTTYARLRNYLPRGFYIWRIKWTDVLVDATQKRWKKHDESCWMDKPCYLLNHETLIDSKTKRIRYEKRRAIDAVNYFAHNRFRALREATETNRKQLAELKRELEIQHFNLRREVVEIKSLKEHLKRGDPIQGLIEVVEATAEQAKLLQAAKQATEALKNELSFLEQKKMEHYAPEQERSVLNRV